MTHASRALQSHDLAGEGINFGSHIYIFDHTGHGGPPRMRDQLNAGATSRQHEYETRSHHARTHSFEQAEYERMIITVK